MSTPLFQRLYLRIWLAVVGALRVLFLGAVGLGVGTAGGIRIPGMVECWAIAVALNKRLPLRKKKYFIE